MTADLSALIARLEAAEAKDAWIHAPDVHLVLFNTSCARAIKSPSVTTSVDAALDLARKVLPPMPWTVSRFHRDRAVEYQAAFWMDPESDPAGKGRGSTPALALCIATLRAKLDGYEVNKNPKAQEG